ncbi:MAG: DUF6198 family protein [Defluviitaleaceae bacterium]|nr:DUF6198 family protein [Defluviitaleaceae bacterium]
MTQKLKDMRFAQRLIIYISGLFILAMGVAFAINAGLGVSPVATLPFVLSLIFDTETGIWMALMMTCFILLQIIIQRREFKWINLTQIVFSFIFGYFVDFARWLLEDLIMQGFVITNYFAQLAMMVVSLAFITSGVTLFIGARLVNLPTEGFCVAVADKLKNGKFHVVKMIMDSSLVAIGIVLSLLFLGGLVGVREGTIISAVAIGKLIPHFRKIWAPVLRLADERQNVAPTD